MYLNEEAREYFFKYSHLNKHINKVLNSTKILKEYLEMCPNTYLSWSCGKDSTVVLSLLRNIDKSHEIPVIHFDLGVELPNTEEYKKNFEDITTFKPSRSLLEVMEEFGFESKECKKSNFIKEFTEKNKFDGHIMGLRYDESSARRNLYKKGAVYKRENDGMLVCNPIYNWSFEDVFAYLISSNVPIHPHYSIKSSQPLEERRVGGYVSGRNRGSEFGRFYWFKEQYPKEFYELANKFKEVYKYV